MPISKQMARSKDQSQFASTCSLPAWWLRRSDQTRSHPELGRQTLQRQWYYVSRPGRVGRRQACKGQKFPFYDVRMGSSEERVDDIYSPFATPLSRLRPLSEGRVLGAGWSSPVARQAHNLKVTGSNPVPATNNSCDSKRSKTPPSPRAGFFLSAANRSIAAKSPRITIASLSRVRHERHLIDEGAEQFRRLGLPILAL